MNLFFEAGAAGVWIQ